MVKIGDRIKEFRRISGFSIAEFADISGLKENTIISYERGYTEPRCDIVLNLCELFGEEVFGNYIQRKVCPQCDEEFIVTNPNQKFCCNDHKILAQIEATKTKKEKSQKPVKSSVSVIAEKARLAGMSYGLYVGTKQMMCGVQ